MLRIDIHYSADTLSLKFEGRFTVMTPSILVRSWRCPDLMRLVVDLMEVTFIDAVGEQVLSFICSVRSTVSCAHL
jgi:hypothetical protein